MEKWDVQLFFQDHPKGCSIVQLRFFDEQFTPMVFFYNPL
jgi:hypothetical protein